MTKAELLEKLDNYGDHLEVKLFLDSTTKYGQYDIVEVSDGRDYESGAVIIELRIEE